jgi:hypothetical protein
MAHFLSRMTHIAQITETQWTETSNMLGNLAVCTLNHETAKDLHLQFDAGDHSVVSLGTAPRGVLLWGRLSKLFSGRISWRISIRTVTAGTGAS